MKILPIGDSALTVEFEYEISENTNYKVSALNNYIKANMIKGVIETVPSYRALLIYYNQFEILYDELENLIYKIDIKNYEVLASKHNIIEIPVLYGGEFGVDLCDVSIKHKITDDEVINIHTQNTYLIYMMGFLPGFPYLGGLDERIATERLKVPRTVIPAGSVGIGGTQTGIYPVDSPGGWRIIGRTPLKIYDSKRDIPVLYSAGDRIRFRAIDEEEYYSIEEQVNNNEYSY